MLYLLFQFLHNLPYLVSALTELPKASLAVLSCPVDILQFLFPKFFIILPQFNLFKSLSAFLGFFVPLFILSDFLLLGLLSDLWTMSCVAYRTELSNRKAGRCLNIINLNTGSNHKCGQLRIHSCQSYQIFIPLFSKRFLMAYSVKDLDTATNEYMRHWCS